MQRGGAYQDASEAVDGDGVVGHQAVAALEDHAAPAVVGERVAGNDVPAAHLAARRYQVVERQRAGPLRGHRLRASRVTHVSQMHAA